jgi:hypothetical protein
MQGITVTSDGADYPNLIRSLAIRKPFRELEDRYERQPPGRERTLAVGWEQVDKASQSIMCDIQR